MNKSLLIIFIICLFSNACVAALPSNAQLGNIEKQVFGYQFQNEPEIKRLDRLEEYLYGKSSKENSSARLKKINSDMGLVDSISQKNNNQKITNQESTPKIVYEKEDSTVSYPVVDKMENKLFSKTYNKENIYTRIDRLEKQVFNQTSANDTLDSRVNKLRLSILKTHGDETIGYTEEQENSSYDENLSNSNEEVEYNSPRKSKEGYFNMELTSLEKVILNDSYTTDSTDSRLNRLESKVFQRSFPNDDQNERLQRISAAATAKKSSAQYDNNKLMKRLSTGAQIGTILLMILAMIL